MLLRPVSHRWFIHPLLFGRKRRHSHMILSTIMPMEYPWQDSLVAFKDTKVLTFRYLAFFIRKRWWKASNSISALLLHWCTRQDGLRWTLPHLSSTMESNVGCQASNSSLIVLLHHPLVVNPYIFQPSVFVPKANNSLSCECFFWTLSLFPHRNLCTFTETCDLAI